MQINSVQENPNFKQIKLNDAELNKAKNIYRQAVLEPRNHAHSLKMFDLFESHLNNEVSQKQMQSTKARKLFATRLYHKFFEILSGTKFKGLPFEKFYNNLNNFSDKFVLGDIDNQKKYYNDYNVTSVKNAANYICQFLNISNETYLKYAQINPKFQHLTIGRFNNEVEELRGFLGFEKDEFVEMLRKTPYTMTRPTDTTIEELKKIKEVLYPEDMEQFKDLVKVNFDFFTLTNDKFQNRLKELSDFFEIDETNAAAMIRAQSRLATMQMSYIAENFNSMKDYLNIDREKMREIAVLAPTIVRRDFNTSVEEYQNVAKMLDMPYEKFIAWSLSTPSIFRISTGKLENVVNYISKELDFTRDESISYISKNLNILSYRLKNMPARKEGNFEVLNEELDIDYNTYKSLLAKNSWFLGNDKELTKISLKNTQKYFNFDKKTFKEIIIKNPVLATLSVEYIDKYINDVAILLNIDKNEAIELAKKCPLLATTPVKIQISNLGYNSKLLNVNERQIIDMCRNNPSLLVERLDEAFNN